MSEIRTIKNRPEPCPTGYIDCSSCQFRDGDDCIAEIERYMRTPVLAALTKLINVYYFFKIGYDVGVANGLVQYILTDEELEALQGLWKEVEQRV